ncbi:hypothetical protein EJ06DRAFT_534350 [Trichodelitschia bisporula]|uniref:Uncharacterized protein n=1 Tax=Trichodelitschia bisporula TaxID=703511 RepID=A0A6G1HJH6_9PEZI|nr:hypothetical protein EJ06DRAFT_534350 [Trichodelitschia bisporula]
MWSPCPGRRWLGAIVFVWLGGTACGGIPAAIPVGMPMGVFTGPVGVVDVKEEALEIPIHAIWVM